jgi:hypothetical protein
MANLVTRKQLALLAGVSKQAIAKACQKAFPDAVVGLRVDLDHADVLKYLAQRDRTPTAVDMAPEEPQPKPTPVRPSTNPLSQQGPIPAHTEAELREFGNSLTKEQLDEIERCLRPIVQKYGGLPACLDALTACKKIADIEEKQLKNAERAGRLISREFVRGAFGQWEAILLRTFGDLPSTLTRTLFALARSGASIEEGETVVRSSLSTMVRSAKQSMIRALTRDDEQEKAA